VWESDIEWHWAVLGSFIFTQALPSRFPDCCGLDLRLLTTAPGILSRKQPLLPLKFLEGQLWWREHGCEEYLFSAAPP